MSPECDSERPAVRRDKAVVKTPDRCARKVWR